jgi:UDP-glucuronate 4-epimerase
MPLAGDRDATTLPDRQNSMSTSNHKPIVVTGTAGFIGYHTALSLIRAGRQVIGIDNVNAYYDVRLKRARLQRLHDAQGFTLHEFDLKDHGRVRRLVGECGARCVIHLAAQAGVRWSIDHPFDYVDANLTGFLAILEACRHEGVGNLIYASSSSVYGANQKLPFSVEHNVDHPISLYAATKKANEAMAHAYSHLYRLPTTGLRFFTVYGPWGRPDMAMWKFAAAIIAGKPIQLYNHGRMQRDFTYVDDIVESIVRLTDLPARLDPAWSGHEPAPATSAAPWRVYNIGNHSPVQVEYVVDLLESHLGRKSIREYVDMQPGDVPATFADVQALTDATGFKPSTSIEDGVSRFAQWYLDYHGA